MKKILLFISIFTIGICYSQTIENLDRKAGFKDIKLGDSYQKWSNDLKYSGSNMGAKVFSYEGNCCSMIFNKKVEKLDLFFKNDILVQITIIPEDMQMRFDESLCKAKFEKNITEYENNFEALFGTPQAGRDVMGNGFVWIGKKVSLSVEFQAVSYNYEGSRYFSSREVITISDIKAGEATRTNNIKNGF